MATPHTTAFPHITRDPRIVGGEPVIKGTRVPVRSIVLIFRTYGDIDRVMRAFPHVSRAAAREALDYYEANRDEIDHAIAENEDIAFGRDAAND